MAIFVCPIISGNCGSLADHNLWHKCLCTANINPWWCTDLGCSELFVLALVALAMYNEAWQRWWPDADAAVCCYRTALLTVPFHDKYFGSLILICFTRKSTRALHRLYHAPFPSLISLSASKYIYHKCLFQISALEYLSQVIELLSDSSKLQIHTWAIRLSGAVHDSFFEHCLPQGIAIAEATQRMVTSFFPFQFQSKVSNICNIFPNQLYIF